MAETHPFYEESVIILALSNFSNHRNLFDDRIADHVSSKTATRIHQSFWHKRKRNQTDEITNLQNCATIKYGLLRTAENPYPVP